MATPSFDIYNCVLLAGVIQGLVMSGLLVIDKRPQRKAARFLAFILLIFSLYNLLIVAYDANLFAIFPLLHYLPLNLVLGFGPCIYFYVISSLNPASTANKRLWVHFLPVAVQAAYYLSILVNSSLIQYRDVTHPVWSIISQIEQTGALLSVFLYSAAAIRLLNDYSGEAFQAHTQVSLVTLIWLRRLLIAYALLWLFWFLYTVTDIFFFGYNLPMRSYYPIYMGVATLTYWMGIREYLRPPVTQIIDKTSTEEDTATSRKNHFDYLREKDIQQYLLQLEYLMTIDRLYLDPALNLQAIADQSTIPANVISFLLNKRLNTTVSEWVSTFRIEEVKKRLTNPDYAYLTLTGIAFDCGFNSKATFNRVFKKRTGQSPTQYLATLQSQKEK
ncbi:MAG: helix-turn-helix transcriptional regulator [Ferruginibacter sp.]|nr:helix-turn-helix transcriptional regulator [Cytophagales bacterium]